MIRLSGIPFYSIVRCYQLEKCAEEYSGELAWLCEGEGSRVDMCVWEPQQCDQRHRRRNLCYTLFFQYTIIM